MSVTTNRFISRIKHPKNRIFAIELEENRNENVVDREEA